MWDDRLSRNGTPWAAFLGSAIGRYTVSKGVDSEERQQARLGLFDAYDEWVDAGRPPR